jgi:hypothetical protein
MSFDKVQPHSRARMKLRVDERDMNDPDRDMSDDRLAATEEKRFDCLLFWTLRWTRWLDSEDYL